MQLAPKRVRENFDRGWLFHRGDILNRQAIKAGMTGGLTDCAVWEGGTWTEIAYSDRAAAGRLNPEEWRAATPAATSRTRPTGAGPSMVIAWS